jgi:hypothetical protein
MRIGKFTKRPGERKRYAIIYSEWLDAGETISAVTFEVTPSEGNALQVDAFTINPSATEVVFFANFGLAGTNYAVDIQVTTSGGQIKRDQILFSVRDS